jgi:hypothetical protein
MSFLTLSQSHKINKIVTLYFMRKILIKTNHILLEWILFTQIFIAMIIFKYLFKKGNS